ncbi:MAG: isoleucine--tRNA ligase, partial [Alkalibacterium sp.]
ARENKIIGKDFEAKTTLYVSRSVKDLLDGLNSDIRQILIASEINVKDLEEKPEDERILDFENVSILVERMQGEVCTRCRITTEESIKVSEDEYLCQRCHDICEEHYPEVLNSK